MATIPDESNGAKNIFAKNLAGEIVFSNEPGKVLRKWREKFKASQKAVAAELKITSSVICDYESGRRKSPGINIIRKYIGALLAIDERNGYYVLREFTGLSDQNNLKSVIIGIKEFFSGIDINAFCKQISADFVSTKHTNQEIYGYTIIDSVRAISELSFNDLVKLYGNTTQRALIFTKVTTGKTPMVAIKLTKLKPGLVVLHGLKDVDDIAKTIADDEKIPLAVCKLEKIENIIEQLKKIE